MPDPHEDLEVTPPRQGLTKVEKCLRLRGLYDSLLGDGPYPTSEVSRNRFSDMESGKIMMHLEGIAGIASHGEKLLLLQAARRDEFRAMAAQSFADRWPATAGKINLEHTPKLHQLTSDTEEARLLIVEVLAD